MQLNLSYQENDADIQSNLSLMDDLKYVIRSLVPEGYEPYFQEQALYASAHTSTAIEGNPLGEAAAMVVLAEGADSEEPDQVEKTNLAEAYEFIAQLGEDKTTRIDAGLIRALNSATLRGLPEGKSANRGRFRRGQNLIIDAQTREIRYRPPPSEFVPELMEDFGNKVGQWRADYPGPIAAALAHFALVSIHPFDDGNGRVARLAAELVLNLSDWSINNMLSLSRPLLEQRSAYYDVLRESQGERFVETLDVTAFVRFHMEELAIAATGLHSKVVAFLKLRDATVRELDFLSPRQVMGVMFMSDIGSLSTTRLARLTRTSPQTALADLTWLLERKAVIREGAGPRTRYRMNPDLRNPELWDDDEEEKAGV